MFSPTTKIIYKHMNLWICICWSQTYCQTSRKLL